MRKATPLILLLLIISAAAACSRPAEPVAIGEVCQKPKDALVEVEGYLVLPNFMTTTTVYGRRENKKIYQLFLVSQPDATGPSLRAILAGTSTGERNRIRELPPTGYTFRDLQIYTDDGATVNAASRVKITGKVAPTADGKCDVTVSKIKTS
jgi:hypothetical protein